MRTLFAVPVGRGTDRRPDRRPCRHRGRYHSHERVPGAATSIQTIGIDATGISQEFLQKLSDLNFGQLSVHSITAESLESR